MSPKIKTDVLICGSGSAGLCAAVWLARMGIDFHIIEKRNGPLKVGQADGVQCRTVEIFESFGLDGELTKDAYWVTEVVFWTTDVDGKLKRTRRTPDVLPGMSWQHHVIMNQAWLNELLTRDMEKSSGKKVTYNLAVKDVQVDSEKADNLDAYPVTAIAENCSTRETTTYQAKYLMVIQPLLDHVALL
jgi:phenol 2-monooxygenase